MARDVDVESGARIGLVRYLVGSVLVLITPIVWLAAFLLVGRHDSASVTLGLIACSWVLAIAFPVGAFLTFHRRTPAIAVAVALPLLILTTVALVVAVWNARLHFA